MRSILLIATGLGIAVAHAQPKALYGYTVVRTLPSPVSVGVGDICVNGSQLFVGDRGGHEVFVIDKFTGVLEDVIATSLLRVGGITHDGTHLWAVENLDIGYHTLLKIDPVTHAEVDTFHLPAVDRAHGMCYHNGQLWINFFDSPTCITKVFDLDGDVVSEYPTPGVNTHGIDFHNGDPWIGRNTPPPIEAAIHRLDPATFTVLDTMGVPPSMSGLYPNGLAWDDEGLWVGESGSEMIYLIVPDPYVGIGTAAGVPAPFSVTQTGYGIIVQGPRIRTVDLLDMQGREIQQGRSESGEVRLDHVRVGGCYIVRAGMVDGRMLTQRFVVP